MGVSIGVWRARIGCFTQPKCRGRYRAFSLSKSGCRMVLGGWLSLLLLLAGDVELNPGPPWDTIVQNNEDHCHDCGLQKKGDWIKMKGRNKSRATQFKKGHPNYCPGLKWVKVELPPVKYVCAGDPDTDLGGGNHGNSSHGDGSQGDQQLVVRQLRKNRGPSITKKQLQIPQRDCNSLRTEQDNKLTDVQSSGKSSKPQLQKNSSREKDFDMTSPKQLQLQDGKLEKYHEDEELQTREKELGRSWRSVRGDDNKCDPSELKIMEMKMQEAVELEEECVSCCLEVLRSHI